MQCFHARNAAGTAKYTHENIGLFFFPKFPQIQVQRSSSKVTEEKRRGRVSLLLLPPGQREVCRALCCVVEGVWSVCSDDCC